jgi:hypothetical protein
MTFQGITGYVSQVGNVKYSSIAFWSQRTQSVDASR